MEASRLSARETVIAETPAMRATVCMVTAPTGAGGLTAPALRASGFRRIAPPWRSDVIDNTSAAPWETSTKGGR